MHRDSTDRMAGIAALRIEAAALRALPCGMTHERIALGPDGLPHRDPMAESGYRRPGICPAAVRSAHLGCSHTTSRIVLMRALDALGEEENGPLRLALQTLDAALGTIDHRRYSAESRRAEALQTGDAGVAAAAAAAIQAIIAEHRELGLRVAEVRDAILQRLDAAAPRSAT